MEKRTFYTIKFYKRNGDSLPTLIGSAMYFASEDQTKFELSDAHSSFYPMSDEYRDEERKCLIQDKAEEINHLKLEWFQSIVADPKALQQLLQAMLKSPGLVNQKYVNSLREIIDKESKVTSKKALKSRL